MLIHGDCLDVMSGMDGDSVDLIYLDPPFNTGRDFGEYDDRWSGSVPEEFRWVAAAHSPGMGSYIGMMSQRLLEMLRLLKPTGSIYLHCDPTASHYLKVLMDMIFGKDCFRNEIAWCYTGPSNTPRHFPRKHDTILFYAMDKNKKLNRDAIRVPYKALSSGGKGGVMFGEGHNEKRMAELRSAGKVPESHWSDINPLTRRNRERTGYPTQKPLALLERIIRASSNPGDVVLDPFCGCATTCDAAERLGRKWIGIDSNPNAIKIAERRMDSLRGVRQ